MGVRRAVDLALESANKEQGPIYTFGPLIHNPQVLALLADKGVKRLAEIPNQGNGTVILRAHGVPPESRDALKNAGFQVIDATCPRVIKVQAIIKEHARKGYAIIIVGDKDHPEVVGLQGYAGADGHVAADMADLGQLPVFEKAIVVAQTTQNTSLYQQIKKWVSDKHPHYKVFDTICDSTEKRQNEVRQLAQEADAVVVVGGHSSGNTQRLAEMARQSGKPAFAIETEAELDPSKLANAKRIVLTAGASTPNWITNRVYRAIERIPNIHQSRLRHLVFNSQRVLLLTSIYVALGAGCLCYACNKLQGIGNHLPYLIMSVLYVLSMHLLNNLTGHKSDRYKDPDRARFYLHHQLSLGLLAVFAGGAGLATAYTLGKQPFMILLIMTLTGLLYNVPLLPRRTDQVRIRKIRDIPGSKTVLIAAAWGIVTALFPALSNNGAVSASAVLVFIWAGGMVFVRTAFFDILDMQGDRIVGRETIPILLGEKKTVSLLKAALVFLVLLLLAGSLGRLISPLGAILAICPALLFIVVVVHERGYMHPSTRLEFIVETHFVLAGALSLLWSSWSVI